MTQSDLTYRVKAYLLHFSILVILFSACRSSDVMTIDQSPEPNTADSLQAEAKDRPTREDTLRTRIKESLKDDLYDLYRSDANRLTNFHVLAQQYFYQANYEEALIMANRALSIRENANTLALRGSIFLGLGDTRRFEDDWRRALELDENVPIPRSEYIITALQNYGIIDSNLNRGFRP